MSAQVVPTSSIYLQNKIAQNFPEYVDPVSKKDAETPINTTWEKLSSSPKWNGRQAYINEYNATYGTQSDSFWSSVQIHHIQPRIYGGSDDFSNLIPVPIAEHQLITTWFGNYQRCYMDKQIERVIESLKIRSDNGESSFKIFQLGRLPVEVKCKFYPAAVGTELKKLENLGLPSDYLDFLRLTNGLELFDEGGSMGVNCHIYPVQEVFQVRDFMKNSGFYSEDDFARNFPILRLRDIGYIYIDRMKYAAGEDYLAYPLPDNNYFQFSFSEWLERYIVSEGNEFWYFLSP